MVKIQGVKYVARDKDGGLYIYNNQPERSIDKNSGIWCAVGGFLSIDDELFPELTWDDEPIQVGISVEEII